MSFYDAVVPGYLQMLNSLSGLLTKAEAHCTARKIQPDAPAGGALGRIGLDDGQARIKLAADIQVLQPGSTTPTIFLDITANVLSGGEQGLLGLAFHPAYATNRRFFVNYTRQPDGATVIAEYQASATDPNVANATETTLLTISQPFATVPSQSAHPASQPANAQVPRTQAAAPFA